MMKLVLALVLSLYQSAVPSDAAIMVPLTLIEAKGAVCLDGSPSAYHLHRGYGSGHNSWLIHLEGGGWCDTVESCVLRKTDRRGYGSSKYMVKELEFTGILSNQADKNPDFFNWNRVKLRYCDGESFSGSGQLETLLSGCSAGGLASIIHCDEFRDLFPQSSTKVKCLSDAGFFLDAIDISGRHTMRDMYADIVSLQCFFPHNLIDNVRTPMFLLNAAYDLYQINHTFVPPSADPHGDWNKCKIDHQNCSSSQIQVFQDFRNEMLNALKTFSGSHQNGLFINSCFAHCHSEEQQKWFGKDSPEIGKPRVAEAVGDWYFDRTEVKVIDCPYPCGNNCVTGM